jgi:crotonobetainyl-CoA:carnitine CoA-transferase CaiB-like acyl-CoA transferase
MAPLSGVTVADFSHHVAGPTCTQLLGQLGACVVKIEPIHGEAGRHAGTVRVGDDRWTTSFFAHNRSKRSIAIDLKNPSGMRVIEAIVKKSDVLVENFRPGVLDRLGLSYEAALALNPRIVYCSITGFGKDGPYRDKPALDLVLQAMGGLMSLTGTEGGPTVPAGAPVADTVSGIYAVVGIMAALYEGTRTGVGQRVDVAMLDAVCALMGARFQQYFATGRDLPALGSGHPQATPWRTFEASDGAFVVTVNTDDLWRRLCEAMGLGALGRDERLQTAAGRLKHRDEITAVLSREFREHPRAHWSELLDRAGVPSGPVLTMSEVAAHPQVANNAIFPEVAGLPGTRTTRMPMRISSTAGHAVTPPPGLGTHSRTILAELGYSEPEIARLEAEGVIYAPQEDQ